MEAQRLQSLALGYFRRNRTSLYKQLVQEEITLYHENMGKSRVVDITENFIVVVPYASPGPYVLTILPRFDLESRSGMDSSDFCVMTDNGLGECAFMLHSCLKRLHLHLDEPCFNLVVQMVPVPSEASKLLSRHRPTLTLSRAVGILLLEWYDS